MRWRALSNPCVWLLFASGGLGGVPLPNRLFSVYEKEIPAIERETGCMRDALLLMEGVMWTHRLCVQLPLLWNYDHPFSYLVSATETCSCSWKPRKCSEKQESAFSARYVCPKTWVCVPSVPFHCVQSAKYPTPYHSSPGYSKNFKVLIFLHSPVVTVLFLQIRIYT